ncbi:MAG: TonB-dependent receptor plug domain-containing protein [Methylococcaceae bacterium]|jgi:vitamin B12 transporter
MKSTSKSALALILTAQASGIQAGEDAVPELETTIVTATRAESSARESGASLSVITAEEIEKRQVLSVADALRLVPGLDILNSGGPGRMTSVYTRGAGAGQTLVLIDMVEMNDPSSPVGAFDFANLTVDNIERIEVLRGGESAIYGSDAIGGVINIITKKGKDKPKVSLSAKGGSYDTFKVLGTATGAMERFNYNVATSETQTHGYSAADYLWGNPEKDWYRNTTFDGRAGYTALDDLDFGVNLRYNHGKSALDYMMGSGNSAHPNAPVDALNYTGTTSELYTRGFSHFNLLDDLWEQTLGLGYSQIERDYRNWDPSLPYSLTGAYTGTKIKGDWQNILHIDKANTLTLGLEDEADTLENQSEGIGSKIYKTQGYYLSDQFTLFERSFTTAAVRYADNNLVGSKVTWSMTEAVLVNETGTKLKGNYGTGYKVPTLYELYAPFYGNLNLAPETSTNWDIGFEQGFPNQSLQFGASYFSNRFSNLIQAAPPLWIAQNINTATAEGVEAFVQVNPLEGLTLRGNYTYDHTLDLETGTQLIYRPTDKGNFEANYRFLEKADLNVVVVAVGEKQGVLGSRIPAYAIANLAGSYTLSDNIKLFARIDNVFNKEYQEVYGYGTTRLAGYGGVTLTY